RRQLGLFTLPVITPIAPSSLRENLDYTEKSLAFALNQLAGDCWSFAARYRIADSHLESTYPALAPALGADRHESATLQQAEFQALFHHPSGFFARAETQWYAQQNRGYSTPLPGDNFFQHNIFVGYRFWHRRGEILFGVLNLSAQD